MIQIWKRFGIFQWQREVREIETPNLHTGAAFVSFLIEWVHRPVLLLLHGMFTTVKAFIIGIVIIITVINDVVVYGSGDDKNVRSTRV
jgi:hypothetical protein